eukprot:10591662-Alexandrium_andersonii.AAC.1
MTVRAPAHLVEGAAEAQEPGVLQPRLGAHIQTAVLSRQLLRHDDQTLGPGEEARWGARHT